MNERFTLLSHPYRRYVLYYLTNESEVVDIDSLATAITKWDGDSTETGRPTTTEDVEIELHHIHLPKLADAGIITFGSDRDSIELRDTTGIARFLDDTASIDGYQQSVTAD